MIPESYRRQLARRKDDPEHREQCALFEWARNPLVTKKHPELRLLSASLNGVKLSTSQAVKAKKAGMLKGEHDVRLPVARGGYVGLSIEMKAGDNRPTDYQLEYGSLLEAEGWKVVYAWSWTEAKTEIEQYLAGPRLVFARSER